MITYIHKDRSIPRPVEHYKRNGDLWVQPFGTPENEAEEWFPVKPTRVNRGTVTIDGDDHQIIIQR